MVNLLNSLLYGIGGIACTCFVLLITFQEKLVYVPVRGYGDSEGYPSQHGLIKDAQAALDHLLQRTDIETTKVVVFGRSLVVYGGHGSNGLGIMNFLVRSPWNTLNIIGNVSAPVLFLSRSQDEMIPPAHMKRLYDAASLNTRTLFIEFVDGMHMDTWLRGGERYWHSIRLFLE
ncbi:hypothetical protein KP509_09G024800 [Ceratopteris richardii]|uniref:Uncharacterized protein n=1 Tax=Ceratopteris richardii TaxID=49495 RepID=A0A8T2U8X9_CERRI|nr:hypothetical protein KP509_09G024800 [Ceratopteris richardii]